MATYPGGWLTLENSNPIPISNFITLASIFNGATTDGNIVMSSEFCNPTGGTWGATPITLNAEPTVAAVNSALFVNEVIKSRAINAQTKMANLAAICPPPLQNMVYLYGNNDDNNLLYQVSVPLNLGAGSYDLFQLSVMENAATQGDEHGNVEVYDFGSATLTGLVTLNLFFSGFYGSVNLGIRLESLANVSSIYELRTIVLPVNI